MTEHTARPNRAHAITGLEGYLPWLHRLCFCIPHVWNGMHACLPQDNVQPRHYEAAWHSQLNHYAGVIMTDYAYTAIDQLPYTLTVNTQKDYLMSVSYKCLYLYACMPCWCHVTITKHGPPAVLARASDHPDLRQAHAYE